MPRALLLLASCCVPAATSLLHTLPQQHPLLLHALPQRRSPSRNAAVVLKADETKGALGGAVLGGLLAGPFGALWGAQIGGSMGANARVRKEEEDALERMGLDRATMDAAQTCAAELVEAERSLKLVEQAASSQQALLGTLDEAMASAYSAAESALGAGDEVGARSRLEERQALKGKWALAEAQWREAEARVASMRSNVASLAERASRIEAAISRTVTSAASREGRSAPPSAAPLEMEPEDPLLRKFRDLEGK